MSSTADRDHAEHGSLDPCSAAIAEDMRRFAARAQSGTRSDRDVRLATLFNLMADELRSNALCVLTYSERRL